MSIYDDLRPIATEILSEFKQGTVKLIQVTTGTGSADNPGAPTETIIPLDAVVKGAPFKYIRDGFAAATDMMVTAAPIDGVTVGANDFIEIDGNQCKIIGDMSTPAAGTRVVWKFLVRK